MGPAGIIQRRSPGPPLLQSACPRHGAVRRGYERARSRFRRRPSAGAANAVAGAATRQPARPGAAAGGPPRRGPGLRRRRSCAASPRDPGHGWPLGVGVHGQGAHVGRRAGGELRPRGAPPGHGDGRRLGVGAVPQHLPGHDDGPGAAEPGARTRGLPGLQRPHVGVLLDGDRTGSWASVCCRWTRRRRASRS